jgi:aerobic carbon-monoxide dehydrogenase small subunit
MTGAGQPDVTAETRHEVAVTVNGRPASARVEARRLLSDFLRHDLELTGTHVGCEHGVCGACTVLLDGEPVRSCLTFAVSVDGREITTVEGLAAEDGTLHPVQGAFQDCHGLQCGFCTPGFVMSVCGFLAERSTPDEDEIRDGLAGNLCRCTGYTNIVRAVAQAAEEFARTGADPRARHRTGPDGPGVLADGEAPS